MNAPASDPAPQTPPKSAPKIRVIAKDLKVDASQRLTRRDRAYIVPNLQGELLKVSSNGKAQPLVNLQAMGYGMAFSVITDRALVIASCSSQELRHRLVAVNRQGKVDVIADFSDRAGEMGAPFGLTLLPDAQKPQAAVNYLMGLSPNTTEPHSLLLQVTPGGEIRQLAELSYGIPLSLAVFQGRWIAAHSKGPLSQTDPATGKSQVLVDLVAMGRGNPLSLVAAGDRLWVCTSGGWLLEVSPTGEVKDLVNLREHNYGLPCGVITEEGDLVILTNSGYLLRVTPAS